MAAAGSGRIGAAWVVPDPPAKIKPAIPIANTVRSICVSLFSMVDPLFIEAVRTTDQLKNNTSRSMNGHSGRNKMGARYYSCHRADKRALPQSVRLWHKNRIAPACRRGDRVNGGMSALGTNRTLQPWRPLAHVQRIPMSNSITTLRLVACRLRFFTAIILAGIQRYLLLQSTVRR